MRASSPAGRGVGLTFHMSPHAGDAASYMARTGSSPVRPPRRLGVLGPHVLVAHAVHIDDDEVDVHRAPRDGRRRLPVGLPASRPGGDHEPGGTASCCAPVDAWPSVATARTPATRSTCCAPRPCSSAWPATVPAIRRRSPPTMRSRWRRVPAPQRSARPTCSACSPPGTPPTSWSTTRPVRSGCRRRRIRSASSCGHRTGVRCATWSSTAAWSSATALRHRRPRGAARRGARPARPPAPRNAVAGLTK